MKPRTLFALFGCVVAGCLAFAGGLASRVYSQDDAGYSEIGVNYVPRRGPDVPNETPACAGGQEALLKIGLEPEAIETTPEGERMRVGLQLEGSDKRGIDVAWRSELVDQDGNIVEADRSATMLRVAAGRKDQASLRTPTGLPDGHYFLRVTAAGLLDDETPTSGLGISYFNVSDGVVTPVDPDTYYAASNINLGRSRR